MTGRTPMGRPIGSMNREKPFNDALRIVLRSNPPRLRRIAEKLTEKAETGDLAAIREVAGRLDEKPVQMLDRRNLPVTELTDAELLARPDLMICANASMGLS
jgi:hypothetical protein